MNREVGNFVGAEMSILGQLLGWPYIMFVKFPLSFFSSSFLFFLFDGGVGCILHTLDGDFGYEIK